MKYASLIALVFYFKSALADDLVVNLPYGDIRGRQATSPGNKKFKAFQGIPYAAAPVGSLRFNLADDLVVNLPYGDIRGRQATSPGNKKFKAFQGIPYAAAPVGSLRFNAPEPPIKWTGIKNTTKDSKICYSVKRVSNDQSEDCLFVNVYTPATSSSSKLPVMLWIFGGAYRTGSAKYNNFGPDYLIEKDVVVVTFNYRLGPFGFLATEDGVVYGNAGLKDQAAAIQWVHDHIVLFGGDPKKVTIFGQSAGGSSVGYQLLYKKNEGLFRAAILQSGSPLSQFSFMGDISARAYAFDLASQIDNKADFKNDSTVLLKFLLNADAEQIHVASTQTTVTDRALPVIEPSHDGAFITKESYELLENGDFIKVPIIIGTTSEEAIGDASDLASLNVSFAKYESSHKKFIPTKGFHLKSGTDANSVGDILYQSYFGDASSKDKLGYFIRYKSDNQYSKPVIKHADLASKFTQVYFYIFSHDGPMGDFNDTVSGAGKVGHSEDDKYIWKVVSSTYTNADLSVFPESDVLAHNRVIELWTNFAKYLNPTPQSSALLQNVTWPKVKSNNFQYLDIGDDLTIQKNPKSPHYDVWTKVYNDYNQRPFTLF